MDSVDLRSEEFLTDINDITSVLKLYFRELPTPLMTFDVYAGFLGAARQSFCYLPATHRLNTFVGIENDRLRHIRLHERVNELPDANYATLKLLMGHLFKYAIS